MQWFFLILLVVPNVAYFIYWLIHMIVEIYKMLYKKSERWFKILSLGLINYEKFGRKYMDEVQVKTPIAPEP